MAAKCSTLMNDDCALPIQVFINLWSLLTFHDFFLAGLIRLLVTISNGLVSTEQLEECGHNQRDDPDSQEQSDYDHQENGGHGHQEEGGHAQQEDGGQSHQEDAGHGHQEEGGHGHQKEGGHGHQKERGHGHQEERGLGQQEEKRHEHKDDVGYGHQKAAIHGHQEDEEDVGSGILMVDRQEAEVPVRREEEATELLQNEDNEGGDPDHLEDEGLGHLHVGDSSHLEGGDPAPLEGEGPGRHLQQGHDQQDKGPDGTRMGGSLEPDSNLAVEAVDSAGSTLRYLLVSSKTDTQVGEERPVQGNHNVRNEGNLGISLKHNVSLSDPTDLSPKPDQEKQIAHGGTTEFGHKVEESEDKVTGVEATNYHINDDLNTAQRQIVYAQYLAFLLLMLSTRQYI